MERMLRILEKRARFNKKRNTIFLILSVVLIGIGLGYAYLTTELSVVGTTNVDASKWDVHFVQESIDYLDGSKEFSTEPIVTDYTDLSFGGTLEEPGDFLGLNIDIVNEGTYNAVLDSVEITPTLTENQQKYFQYSVTYSDGQIIREGDPLFVNESKTIKVYFEYIVNEETGNYPEEDTPFDFNVDLHFSQLTDSNIYLLSFDCTTNGGNSCANLNEYKPSGSVVTLPTEVPNNTLGYQFAGWLNDQNQLVNTVTMGEQNVNLIATYGSLLTINYQKGAHVGSIGKTTDTCVLNNNETSCNVTLPSITADSGYSPDGWYKGENKVGDANQTYAISGNETLTAMAQDSAKPVCSYTTIPTSITYNSTGNFVMQCSDQQGPITAPTLTTSPFTVDKLEITNISSPTTITNGYQWTITTRATTGTGSGSLAFKANIVEDTNGNKNNAVSGSVSLEKITPEITISQTGGIVKPNGTVTFTEQANVAGKFTNTSGTTGVATVSPGTSASTISANTDATVTVTGGSTTGTSTITVTFVPSQTENYNSITSSSSGKKTYTLKNYAAPTYSSVNVSTGKKVTITYPSVCNTTGFTCKYKVGNGSETTTTSNSQAVTVTSTGSTTITATVYYGSNSISSSYTVSITAVTLTARANIGGKVVLENTTKGTSATAQSNSSATLSAINGDTIKATATAGVSGYYYSLYKLLRGSTGFNNSSSGLTNMSSGSTFTAGTTNQEVRGIFEITNQTYAVQSGAANYWLWWYSSNQNVGLYPYTDISNEKWNLVTRGVDDNNNVYYTLALQKNGYLLSITNSATVYDGIIMVAKDTTVQTYKQFYLVPKQGLLQIKHKNSGKCLTYNTSTLVNGSNALLWTCSDSERAHVWAMTPPSLLSS